MDTKRFDVLTRSLTTRSRRHFSRALAGLTLAGGVGSMLRQGDAEARKKRNKKKKNCKGATKKCGKRCIPEADCCTDAECNPTDLGLICVEGACICGARRGVSIQAC